MITEQESQTGYLYTQQLLELEQCKPVRQLTHPTEWANIQTSAKIEEWEKGLADHPDQWFAKFILQGLKEGFRVGYDYQTSCLRSAHGNMVVTNPEVITAYMYIRSELEANRLVELTKEDAEALLIHRSPKGIIPKKNKPGKWCLIVDLSSPTKASVNDGIKKELCSLSYTSVDAVAAKIVTLGRHVLLAKIDVKQAYRMVPVHPDDRGLLGMSWEGKVYIDKTLPFGLRSAPLICTAVADALLWLMRGKGVSFVDHYLDDFITLGKPKSMECADNFRLLLETCKETGTPVEAEKSEGPTTKLIFWGIETDSSAWEMRLPTEKLAKLRVSHQMAGQKSLQEKGPLIADRLP